MRKRILASTATGLLFAAAALPAAELDERLDAARDSRVMIVNMAGSVEVSGWNRNVVELTGTIGDEVEELIFERDGRDVEIRVKTPGRSRGYMDVSADLEVRVPKDSSLEIATVSADIEVEGVYGEQELQAVSGDIRTQAFSSEIDIESVSGDVDVDGDNTDSKSEVVSVSGDITLGGLAGTIETEVVSGDIVIDSGSFDRAEVQTVNGDVVWRAELRRGGKVYAETVNGSLDFGFTGDVSAEFDIETFNGKIDNCFGPKPERVSKYAPGWELSFSHGGGDGRVSLATLNGRIRVCND